MEEHPTTDLFRLQIVQYGLVSQNFFKLDGLVELWVYYDNYLSSSSRVVIIDETGSVISDINKAYYMQAINTSADTFKVIANLTDPTIQIYSIPGTLPCSACSGGLGMGRLASGNLNSASDPSPNPSSGRTTITYTLPEGVRQGTI
jgi:hypothetical protein